MRKLLSLKDYRVLNLFEILAKNDIPISELLKMINVSPKTLYSDIEYLNTIVSPIQLTKDKIGTLSLCMPKNYSVNYVYSKLLENSIHFLFLEKIFFNEKYTLPQLSEELFISPSSLRRIISHLNDVLKQFSIKITLSPITIIGKEASVRNLYIHYFLEKFPNGIYPFSKFQKKILDTFLNYSIKKNSVILNYTDLEKLRVSTIVSLIRMQNDHYIDFNPELNSKIDYTFESNLLLKTSFKSVFKIKLTEKSIFNMLPFLFSGKFFFSYDQLLEASKSNSQVKNGKDTFELIIDNISDTFKLNCQNKESLQVDLCTSYFLNYGPPFILYDFCSEFVNHVSITKSELIDYIKLQFKIGFGNVLLEDYHINSYIYILISHWKDLYLYIEKRNKIFSIGIFFNTDFEQNLLVQNIIDFHFGTQVKTTIINGLNIHEIIQSFSDYDLVITNIPGLLNQNILCLSSFPTKKDLENIQSAIRGI